jgi:hypothetical protein
MCVNTKHALMATGQRHKINTVNTCNLDSAVRIANIAVRYWNYKQSEVSVANKVSYSMGTGFFTGGKSAGAWS